MDGVGVGPVLHAHLDVVPVPPSELGIDPPHLDRLDRPRDARLFPSRGAAGGEPLGGGAGGEWDARIDRRAPLIRPPRVVEGLVAPRLFRHALDRVGVGALVGERIGELGDWRGGAKVRRDDCPARRTRG